MNKDYFDNIINTYFPNVKIDKTTLFNMVEGLNNLPYELYLIAHYVVYNCTDNDYDYFKFVNFYTRLTSCYVSPFAKLGNFVINGINIYIGDNVIAGDNLKIGSNVTIGKCQNDEYITQKQVLIGKNCTLCDNAKVYLGTRIGDDVTINSGAIIKEEIADGVIVDVVNQLQLKQNDKALVSSQKLFVYGIVPKYKNTIVIYGEGFYNPKVVIKLKKIKELDYAIGYWDKNKIIVKLKNSSKIDDSDNLIVIMSNGVKITLINNFGLTKALKSINN